MVFSPRELIPVVWNSVIVLGEPYTYVPSLGPAGPSDVVLLTLNLGVRIKYSKRDVEFHKGGGAHQDLAKLPFLIPSLNLFLPLGVDAAQDILRQDILRQEIQNKLC